MPAKVVTLNQKDQDLLRVALTRAEEWQSMMRELAGGILPHENELTERIKDLRARLV